MEAYIFKLSLLFLTASCFHAVKSERTPSKHKKTKIQNEDDFAPVKIQFLTIQDLTDSYEVDRDNFYSSIKGLSIENSNLSHVPMRLLNEFVSLKELRLRNNSIGSFKIERLNSAHETMSKNVEHLHIEKQDLGALTNNSFMKYKNLTSLALICTNISTIESNAFNGLKKLLKLDLKGNRLRILTRKTLSPLINLEILSLQGNRFKSLSDIFGGTKLAKLQILHMENNPIKGINYLELKNLCPNLRRYEYCIGHMKPCKNDENVCEDT